MVQLLRRRYAGSEPRFPIGNKAQQSSRNEPRNGVTHGKVPASAQGIRKLPPRYSNLGTEGRQNSFLDRYCELRSVGRLALERKEQNKQDADHEENIQSNDQRQVSHDLRFRFWDLCRNR